VSVDRALRGVEDIGWRRRFELSARIGREPWTSEALPAGGSSLSYPTGNLGSYCRTERSLVNETPDLIRTLDLFAGAGGLSLGFAQADLGFVPVQAVEIDPAAAHTFKRNFDCPVHDGPIEELESFEKADVVLGGPPCQGFSPLGKHRDADSRARLNALWEQYLRAVRLVRPRAFVIENVPQFQKSAQFAELLRLMVTDEDLREYQFAYGVLNAADYGVPQLRRRGIFMAVKGVGAVPWPPPATHGPKSKGQRPYSTVERAFEGLSWTPERSDVGVDLDGGQDLHFGRNVRPISLERYAHIPPGGNRFDLMRNAPEITPRCWLEKPTGTTDVMGRMWWERPSGTIRTEFYKPEKGRYLHPEAHRPITHREAARLQSFPDDFEFVGNRVEIARQIGNAVPPGLAKAIALHLHSLLEPSGRD
jgi:DNA (cytosine-5)-methyltransferase 1